MATTRRDFSRLAVCSTIVLAFPMGRLLAAPALTRPAGEVMGPLEHALAPEITVESEEKGKMKAQGKTRAHIKRAVTTEYLSDGMDDIGWGQYSVREPNGYTALPRDGQMSALIDYKGNWEFSGSFPRQQMRYPCATAVGLGLKSSLGKVIAFVANGNVPAMGDGWNFSKQGNSPIVADLWKEVVKGHEFHGHWYTQQVAPRTTGGGDGGGDVGAEVLKGVETGLSVLGTILAFL
jgi:hypothetical protein